MNKSTSFEYPVIPLIKNRRSLRAYSDRVLESETIYSLFEAARWAPSSSNEQPWTYLHATKSDHVTWQLLFDCLNEGNKIWAKNAPLLIMSMARKTFLSNGNHNAFAFYDLGAANAFLSLQAVELGLQIRQMGGYNQTKAKESLNIPDSLALGPMIAAGYPGDPMQLPEPLKLRETTPRERYAQHEFVTDKSF
jgi:nitroreductase